MKNKPLHTPGASEEPPKENDGEENNGVWTNGTNPNLSTERCPICLNFLTQDVGFPENCYHAFCVNCILRWSETSTSCPVDRKPFQIVYKINPAAGCTKIQVKTRRQRERCCCNGNPLYTLCCAKTKIRYRTDSNKDLISHNVLFNKSDSFISKEEKQASESELKNLNRHEPCYTSDFVSPCQQNVQLDLPLIGLHDVSEDGELGLIKQKREGLKYLRPTGVATRSDFMSLSGETEALSVSTTACSLVDYIPPLCNFSIRNQGFSKRTCVHSSAQEGTEKKAASGASNGRGSRRKASQSSTRRRSTRNSKSEDMSHLPSSPKSNASDRDSPDCNNSSANVSSADHTVKTPPKQRKRVPKKRSQARKRLRSATRTQEESSGSKENSADESEEQLVKTRKISKQDAFKTADSHIDSVAEHNVDVQEHEDGQPSPPVSPIQSQSDENTPTSPPVRTEPFSHEKTLDSSSQNEQEFDIEDEPSSQNNSVLMEKKSPTSPASVNLGNSACDHLAQSPVADKSPFNSDEEASDFKKPQSSEGENCSFSPVPKGDVSDHTESPLSQTARRKGVSDEEDSSFEKQYESDTEGNEKTLSKHSHESNSSDSSSSDEDDLPPKSDRPVEYLRNQSAFTEPDDLSDSRNGQLSPEPPLLENALNTSMDEKNSLSDQENPPELDNSPDFKVGENETNSASAESGLQEVPSCEKHNMESAVQESSCMPAEKYSMDDEAEGSSRNVQEAELKLSVEGKEITIDADESCKCSPEIQAAPTALQNSRPCLINSHSNDGFHDTNNNETEGSSMPLDVTVNASLQTSHKSSNLSMDDGSFSDQRKESCDQDNNESIAMECESDSDHNESEIEQRAETDKIKGAESSVEMSVIKEEVKPQSAETVCVNEKTNEEAPKKESRPRRSRFHSPSTTWSPLKTDVKERQRSPSKGRDSPGKRRSRSKSRDRDGSRDRGGQWKGRSRERWHRRHSRSKSRSRSRSRSPSRPAARNKGPPPDRNEMGCGSPPWRERNQYDNWRSPRGNERYRRHDQEKPSENFRRDRHDPSRDSSEPYKDSSNQNDYPDWVAEKIKSETRGKNSNRARVSPRGSHWDSNHYNQGDSWNKSPSMDWQSPRGRGGRGRGRGGFCGGFGYGDQSENRWNSRPTFSGNSNSPGPESSRFPEQRNYRPKYEQEPYDSPADRSGWSSASSWAVRKTLPADVQNYYSKRGRSQAGSQPAWPKQDESPDQALKVDQPIKDQVSQPAEAPQMPVNLMPPQMNVVQPQMNQPPPQPMNMFPYSVSVPPPPLVNIQHNPYSIHPQLPMHIHPGLPIQVPVQVSAPASVSQGLPPPPPPPPPSQQVSYVTSQPEGKPMQVNPGATHVGNNFSASLLPAPAATMGIVGTLLGPNAGIVASSTYSKTTHSSVKPPVRKEVITVEATADSSKKEKKLQIQERAAHEVKMAIKQYYQNKDITKDEYKEIVKKAVDKVCHSKSGEVDSAKVANLIKAYVDKYKHSRKKE